MEMAPVYFVRLGVGLLLCSTKSRFFTLRRALFILIQKAEIIRMPQTIFCDLIRKWEIKMNEGFALHC